MGLSCGWLRGCVVLASVVFDGPVWDIEKGWEAHRSCRQYWNGDSKRCRRLAEDTFRKAFPALRYEWPACNKDDMAEAVLWAAVHDPGLVGRYMAQFRRICR